MRDGFRFFRWSAAAALALALAATVRAARPVARWDVVPDQVFTGVFQAGVCAFHTAGVQVEFRVGGSLVHTAANPAFNGQSGVWEFWCPLDAGAYADSALTLDARAVPLDAGQPSYDLPSLNLHANRHGTLTVSALAWVDSAHGSDTNAGTQASPYATLAKAVKNTPSGGTINLLPGVYASQSLGGGSSRPYWTTVQAAPGVARDSVEIAAGRPGTQRVCWRNVTLACDTTNSYATILTGENGAHSVWVDNCKAYNKRGRWAAGAVTFGNRYVAYVTGGLTTQMANGPGASLIRGHAIETITSDAWTGSGKLVVNCTTRDIDPGPTAAHPDFHQSYAVAPEWCEDVILYNVRGTECISQGLFGSRLRNSAFVNVLFEKGNTVMYSQYSGPMENVLFLHLTIVRQSWLWRAGYTPVDVQVRNGIYQNMQQVDPDPKDGLAVDRCHFVDPAKTMGTTRTTGDAGFRNAAAHDFRLLPSSPAHGTGETLQCVPADIDGLPHPSAAGRNRGCHADAPTGTVVRVVQAAPTAAARTRRRAARAI